MYCKRKSLACRLAKSLPSLFRVHSPHTYGYVRITLR